MPEFFHKKSLMRSGPLVESIFIYAWLVFKGHLFQIEPDWSSLSRKNILSYTRRKNCLLTLGCEFIGFCGYWNEVKAFPKNRFSASESVTFSGIASAVFWFWF